MACSVDVPSNFIVAEKENSETTESHNPTVPVASNSIVDEKENSETTESHNPTVPVASNSIVDEKENSETTESHNLTVPVASNFIVDEKENSETAECHNPTVPVLDSAEVAVAIDLGVSGTAVDSLEVVDGRLNTPEKPKVKKVTFFTVKHVDSNVDLEKGLDVKDAGEPTRDGKCADDDDGEKVCRVCHLSSDCRSGLGDLIQIGCGCKDDLGIAHRHCAEAWFRIRGNRTCEICGETAKNIVGAGDADFIEEWNERDLGVSSSGETPRCWRGRPLCNFLMACMVVAFILPWFFRVSMF